MDPIPPDQPQPKAPEIRDWHTPVYDVVRKIKEVAEHPAKDAKWQAFTYGSFQIPKEHWLQEPLPPQALWMAEAVRPDGRVYRLESGRELREGETLNMFAEPIMDYDPDRNMQYLKTIDYGLVHRTIFSEPKPWKGAYGEGQLIGRRTSYDSHEVRVEDIVMGDDHEYFSDPTVAEYRIDSPEAQKLIHDLMDDLQKSVDPNHGQIPPAASEPPGTPPPQPAPSV